MKKILLALLLLGPLYASAGYTLTVSPSNLSDYNAPIVLGGSCDGNDTDLLGYTLLMTAPSGGYLADGVCSFGAGFVWINIPATLNIAYGINPVELGVHNFSVIKQTEYDTLCGSYDYNTNDFAACSAYIIETIGITNIPAASTFSSMLANAQAGYSATVGGSVGSDVSYVGTNFIMLFIGSGLALLFSLRYWIVAMIIISAVIYFSFKAFRFFRH